MQLNSVDNRGGWWSIIREAAAGDWQRGVEISNDTALSFFAVFSCVSLIAADVSKLELSFRKKGKSGVPAPHNIESLDHLLKNPNHFQNRIKFIEQWLISKLTHGNTYVFKRRDARGNVDALYVLAPQRVRPLVSPSGDVFYSLQRDDISGIPTDGIIIPASEIIHDTYCPIFHPLMGVTPIFACGLAAAQGIAIQNNSTRLFQNMSRPGGVLTAPGSISPETAERLKQQWTQNYTGANFGKVAVLSDGLKFDPAAINPVDAQLIEQLKWSGETVCSVYKVPAYKVGVTPPPTYNNIEALDQQYYSQCLQNLIESIEDLLGQGLGLPAGVTVRFDLKALMRMDTATRFSTWEKGVKGGWMSPNEARAEEDLPPVEGGDTPYMQQQNFPLSALAHQVPSKTDAPVASEESENQEELPDVDEAALLALFEKCLRSELSVYP